MTSTIDDRPPAPGPDDPTGRFPSVPRPLPGPQGFPPRNGPGPQAFPPPYGPGPGRYPGPPPWQALPPQGAYPVRTQPRWAWIVLAGVGALLVLVLIAVAVSATRTMTVSGSVTLRANGFVTPGSSCNGAGPYSWLESGSTVVTIYDASGAVVGTTTLGTGTAVGSSTYGYATSCVFPFTLTGVPAGDDFYRVKAGSSAGDGVTFTAAQLRGSGADLVVGSDD